MVRRFLTVVIATLGFIATNDGAAWAQREGIQVRGHWIFDVKNADGTLAARTEFDNHLISTGSMTLSKLLLGTETVRAWRVKIAYFGNAPFFGPTYLVDELTPTAALVGQSVQLTTSIKPALGGSVDGVSTHTCSSIECTDGSLFSSASVSSRGITFKPGQTIDVQVLISFSPKE